MEPALWLWAPDDGRDRPWRKFQHLYWPLPFSLTFLLWRIDSVKTAITKKLTLEVCETGMVVLFVTTPWYDTLSWRYLREKGMVLLLSWRYLSGTLSWRYCERGIFFFFFVLASKRVGPWRCTLSYFILCAKTTTGCLPFFFVSFCFWRRRVDSRP